MKNSYFWSNVSKSSWQRVPYPWKPDWFDLMFYTLFILRYSLFSKKPVLLLGATQELRFLLSSFRVKYDLVDTSAHMETITKPNRVDSLRYFSNLKWEEYNTTEKYSLVIGDLILNLCTQKKVDEILGKDYGCYFLSRVRLPTKISFGESLKFIEETIMTDKISEVDFFYSLLANTQTLLLVFKKSKDQILPLIFKDKTYNNRKKIFEGAYLKYSPEYFLHEEQFLRTRIKTYRRYLCLIREHPCYVDRFGFFIQKNNR